MTDKEPTSKLTPEEISNIVQSDVPHEEIPVYPEKVLELVRAEAQKLLEEGQKNRQVQFGWEFEGGNFWLSRDSNEIVDPREMGIGGELFYFGIFKK